MKHLRARLGFIVLVLIVLGSFAETAFAQSYTVVRGDTLTRVSIRFNVSVTALMNANGIRNPNRIYVGQQLVIPGVNAAPPPNPNPAPDPEPPVYAPPSLGAKWIDINLSRQTMTAYEGSTPVKTTLVSTGTARHPTVTGTFNIYVKLRSAPMTGGSRAAGDYYYLPNVPNIMYFYYGYGIHGAYWHNNFGRVMSHGCVNVNLTDAKWFFDWAGPYVPPGVNVV
ncbi:MAG: L,D-transpeptidase family protein, partial [Chloroflexi bacterium]|nr:L,D-transpeptidase family protein [Chloroflexota bacterium]